METLGDVHDRGAPNLARPDILMACWVDIGVVTVFLLCGLSQPVEGMLCIELLVESDGCHAGLQVASLTQELGNTRALLDYHQYHHKQMSRAHGDQEVELRNLRSAHRWVMWRRQPWCDKFAAACMVFQSLTAAALPANGARLQRM